MVLSCLSWGSANIAAELENNLPGGFIRNSLYGEEAGEAVPVA